MGDIHWQGAVALGFLVTWLHPMYCCLEHILRTDIWPHMKHTPNTHTYTYTHKHTALCLFISWQALQNQGYVVKQGGWNEMLYLIEEGGGASGQAQEGRPPRVHFWVAGGWAPLCIMQTLASTVAALIFAVHTVSYLHYKLSNANMTATTQCLLNNSIICRQWGWWVNDRGHWNVRFMSWNKYRWEYNTNTKLSVIKILRETRIETWKMGEVIFQGGSHRIVSPILPRHTSSSCNTKILLPALQKYKNKHRQKFKWKFIKPV